MSFERKIILNKLEGFLAGVVSQSEIYEWALFVVVSKDYEELAKQDPLAEKLIQFLIEINHERPKAAPTREIIKYYSDCLDGKKEFDAHFMSILLGEKAAPGTTAKKATPVPVTPSPLPDASSVESKPGTVPQIPVTPPRVKTVQPTALKFENFEILLKGYVLVFAVISLLLNLTAAINPGFLVRPGEIPPSTLESWSAAFPHVIYGLLISLAMMWRPSKAIFYIFFFTAALGMFFYWYVATDFILRQHRSLLYLLLVAPFVTLPPTVGFFLLLNRWFAETARKPKLRVDNTSPSV